MRLPITVNGFHYWCSCIHIIRLSVFPPLLVLYPGSRHHLIVPESESRCRQTDDSFLICTLKATQRHPIPHIRVDTTLDQDTYVLLWAIVADLQLKLKVPLLPSCDPA